MTVRNGTGRLTITQLRVLAIFSGRGVLSSKDGLSITLLVENFSIKLVLVIYYLEFIVFSCCFFN